MALSITFPGLSDVLDKGLDSNFINHLTGYLISFLTLGVLWYMRFLSGFAFWTVSPSHVTLFVLS